MHATLKMRSLTAGLIAEAGGSTKRKGESHVRSKYGLKEGQR